MGELRPHARGRLFCGLLLGAGAEAPAIHARLVQEFGPALSASEIRPFTQTRFYEEEMGPHLRRQFVAFEALIAPPDLVRIKCRTNEIERERADAAGRRSVNIDPGCVTLAKVVLASTKDHAHRLALGEGVHGEVTLVYHRGKGFEPWPWTYPDYREAWVRDWFAAVRASLRA